MALAIGTDPVAKASLLSLSDEILVMITDPPIVLSPFIASPFCRCTSYPISPALPATSFLSAGVTRDSKDSAMTDVLWMNSILVATPGSQRRS